MKIYKPSELALQNIFVLGGTTLTFPKEFEDWNTVRYAFNRRAFEAQVKMTNYYENQIRNIDDLLSKGIYIMEKINKESAEFDISVLMWRDKK